MSKVLQSFVQRKKTFSDMELQDTKCADILICQTCLNERGQFTHRYTIVIVNHYDTQVVNNFEVLQARV